MPASAKEFIFPGLEGNFLCMRGILSSCIKSTQIQFILVLAFLRTSVNNLFERGMKESDRYSSHAHDCEWQSNCLRKSIFSRTAFERDRTYASLVYNVNKHRPVVF